MIQVKEDSRIVENFTFEEMASDGVVFVNKEVQIFMNMIQLLRDTAVATFPKIFGIDGLLRSNIQRSKAHNKRAKGAINSTHLDGRAIDVTNIDTTDETLVQWFILAWRIICTIYGKIGGIEIGKDYMHFDNYSDKFGYKTFRIVDKR